ncbi:ABC transporter permease [Carboxydochorda subterranea]|uniref:ABC transporter permease n=1 Tax=Carboxydichorda subterranea TaxID=3109565 RepID=A0ABZ1BXZ5_9FIRM|nr:ABC transporter permease [Limnochorda sp. L945t]WRP17556.1 ABC transporter permease [Limnochorda sp. L945t]
MVDTGRLSTDSAPVAPTLQPGRCRGATRQRPGDWRAWAGLVILAGFTVLGLLAPLLAPYGADRQDLTSALQPPGPGHWLGTDELGRDILSRLLYGVRPTTLIPSMGVAIGALVGIVLGLGSAYLGPKVESLLMGLTDLVLTFPSIVLAIAIVTILGVGEKSLALAIAAAALPGPARIARAAALKVKGMEYFEAAKAVGASDVRMVLRYLLPNVAPALIVQITLELSQAVLLSAALGFLGLGVQPPAPEWGTMLSQARGFVHLAPHMMVFPGLAIALLVFALNMAGDALRDHLDPARSTGLHF